MKFTRILNLFAAGALLMGAVTSCDNGNEPVYNPEVTLTLSASNAFTACKDLAAGAWTTYQGPTYTFTINHSTLRASLKIEKLAYDGGTDLAVTIPDLVLTYESGTDAWVMKQQAPMTVTDAAGISHAVTGTQAYIFASGLAPEICRIEYTLDNSYTIRAVMKYNAFTGSTSTTVISDGAAATPSVSEDIVYFLVLDQKTSKAQVLLYDAKFTASMPYAMDLDFLKQPFTVTDSGLCFDVPQSFDPENNGTPYNRFAITGLKLDMAYTGAFTGSFTCGGAYDVAIDASNALAIKESIRVKMIKVMQSASGTSATSVLTY